MRLLIARRAQGICLKTDMVNVYILLYTLKIVGQCSLYSRTGVVTQAQEYHNMSAGVFTPTLYISEDEIDLILDWREFTAWYDALSAPAKRTLAILPNDTKLSIARRAVHLRKHGIIQRVFVATPPIQNERVFFVA